MNGPKVTEPKATTHLYAAFAGSTEQWPEHKLFHADGGRGESYTYSEVRTLVDCLAAGLLEKGIVASNQLDVGLISENRPEWPIAYLAILAAGGTVVPIDANLKPTEIAYLVGHAGLKTIFCSKKSAELLGEVGSFVTMLSFDGEDDNNWLSIKKDSGKPTPDPANETAVLIYTSGTTGRPKAVELTHQNLITNLEGVCRSIDFREDEVFLSLLPLHHTFEATCGFLLPIMRGASIVYARSLKSKEIIEDIGLNGVTVMIGVPLLFEKMSHAMKRGIAAAPTSKRILFSAFYGMSAFGSKLGFKWGESFFRSLRAKAGFGTIRMFVSGGAALPAHVAEFFNHLGFLFFQGYGMTECSPVVSFNRTNDVKFGSVGIPLPNLEVKIDKANSEGIGEVIVRGDSITPGYRNNPEQTAELLQDGWLHTGDLGRFKSGHLWITGRAKNLIVSAAGKNIYPEEIEEKLSGSDRVLEVVVFGRTKEGKHGEEVHALIVPDLDQLKAEIGIDPANPDLEKIKEAIAEVVAEVNNLMADYKRITKFEIQLEELQKTSTKKVKRFIYK